MAPGGGSEHSTPQENWTIFLYKEDIFHGLTKISVFVCQNKFALFFIYEKICQDLLKIHSRP